MPEKGKLPKTLPCQSKINGQIRHLCTSDSDRINNIATKISEQEGNFRVRRIVTDKVRWM